MYADKIIKIVNKSLNSVKSKASIKNPPFDQPKKILVTLPNFIGDVVLLIPFLRNLRYNVGESINIDVICNKNIRNLVETLPYLDHLHLNENVSINRSGFLKDNGYDTVFMFNIPLLWGIASHQARVKQRISFNLERIGLDYPFIWRNLTTHLCKGYYVTGKKPQWQVYLDILTELGMEVYDNHIEVILTNDDLYRARKLMQNIKMPRVGIHVTAASPGKQWELDKWSYILQYLSVNYNCSFIATGTRNEKDLYDYLSVKSGVDISNFCGKTTIRETTALYRYLDLIITLDTAPAHLAAAANTKNIVVMYGPTNEAQWIPHAPNSEVRQIYETLSCRPCITRICHHKNCINKIETHQVISAIDKLSFATVYQD